MWNRALSANEVKALYDYGGQYSSGVRDVDFNARRYDPETMLFEQPDSIISNVYNPQALNRYMFEEGNPYNHRDPTGHDALACPGGNCGVYLPLLFNPYVVGGVLGGLTGYFGGSYLREVYPPSQLGQDIYEYGYAGPRQGLERMISKMQQQLEELAQLKDLLDQTRGDTRTNWWEYAESPYDLKLTPYSILLPSTSLIQNSFNLNYLQNIQGLSYQNQQITLSYTGGGSWTSSEGGLGTYTPPDGGNPYPNAPPGWKPKDTNPPICVSGC